LEFDTHLFVRAGASSIELESEEVKNDNAIGYDIPTHLAKMLHDRDRIAPSILATAAGRFVLKLAIEWRKVVTTFDCLGFRFNLYWFEL
jgi:hypothetical protein